MSRMRIAMTRSRWRMCLFGFTYYLCAVLLLENIIAVVYWNRSYILDSDSVVDSFSGADRVEPNGTRLNSPMPVGSPSPTPQNVQSPEHVATKLPPEVVATKLPPEVVVPQNRSSMIPPKINLNVTQEDLEREFYRIRDTKVNPYLYDFVLRPKTLCDTNTFMIILVHSHHPNTERRSAIRKTWGSATLNGEWPNLPTITEKIKLVFVLGTHKDAGLNDVIREEWQQFDDIVQGNFYDSYQNMTLKSLLGLKLVTEHCSSAKFLFKDDDDMFINVPYLVRVLQNRTLHRAIMGPLNVGSKVYRNGKWKVSKQEFPFQFYPPYESGAAYMITCDIVRELFETSEYVPSIFIDDVYITGILGKILNVTHEKQKGFAYWTNRPPSPCDIVENRIISGTKMTPALLLSTWAELKKGPNCKTTQIVKPKPTFLHS